MKYTHPSYLTKNKTLIFKGEIIDDKVSWSWETDCAVFPFAPPGDIIYAWGAAM